MKIAEKQSQISRLRANLLSIENNTPPRNTKTDENSENKKLRDEIISIEKYVQILHQEQEDLQNDRDKARDKVNIYRVFRKKRSIHSVASQIIFDKNVSHKTLVETMIWIVDNYTILDKHHILKLHYC